MVVFDTVDPIFGVHSEGHSIKALVTDDTAETAWVVRLPEGLQDLWRGMSNTLHVSWYFEWSSYKKTKKKQKEKKERTFWWVNWVIITAQNSLRQITQQNTRSKLTYQTNHKDWPNFNTFYLQQEKLRNLLYSAYWMVNICRLMPTEILYFLTCDDITSGCF